MSRYVAIVEDSTEASAVEGTHVVEVQEFRHAAEFVIEIINELVKYHHFSKCNGKIIDMDTMQVVAATRNYNKSLQLNLTLGNEPLCVEMPYTLVGLPYIKERRAYPGIVNFATWS